MEDGVILKKRSILHSMDGNIGDNCKMVNFGKGKIVKFCPRTKRSPGFRIPGTCKWKPYKNRKTGEKGRYKSCRK